MKRKFACVLLVMVIALSMFGIVSASTGTISRYPANYERCFCYDYESSHSGYHVQYEQDEASLTAFFPPYSMGEDCLIEARWFKRVTVDGALINPVIYIGDPPVNPWEHGGNCWFDTEVFYHQDNSYGEQIQSEYDLNFDSIMWGYDIFPWYVSPQDLYGEGVNFRDCRIDVTFYVEWWYYDYLSGPIYKIDTTGTVFTAHNEPSEGWEYVNICSDCTKFVTSVYDTEVYGTGYLNNPDNMEDCPFTKDGNVASFSVSSAGATSRAFCYLGGSTIAGDFAIYARSSTASSYLLTYVSTSGSSWTLLDERSISYSAGMSWITLDSVSAGYKYALFVLYSSGGSQMILHIDAVQAGGDSH